MKEPCEHCRPIILAVSRRLCAASEVLGQLATRDGRVAEIVRLRAALEWIAAEGGVAGVIAEEALRWK